MTIPLRPCSACRRHIRITDATCPFCLAETPAGFAEIALPRRPGRLGRAAIFAFGATLAGAACDKDGKPVDGSSSDTANMSDGSAGNEAAPEKPASDTTPAEAAMDGPPVMDDGGVAPAYGVVSPPDAATDDEGGAMPLYGAVPSP